MTYTCQIRVASAMINTVKRAKSKTPPALAQIMINAGEYRSLKIPPAGVRMVPGIDATASTRPSSAPDPVTRSTSHVRATRKAWSATIERPAPAHNLRKERASRGFQKWNARNRLNTTAPIPRSRRTPSSLSSGFLSWLYCLNGTWYGIVYQTERLTGWRRKAQMHIAQKFEALLEMYRRPDGRKWSGQEIDEATGGT